MGLPKEFNWSEEWEPHQARRAAMLKKYGPQIKALYGPDPWVPAQALLVVALQVSAAWAVRDMDVWQLLVAGYLVGAFANHNLFLAVHELTHNLGFKRPLYNKLMAIIANLPIGVPMATKFQKYHREHHTSQGVHGVDMDIATRAEAEWIHNGWEKLVWTVCQLFFYALRPVVVRPFPPEIWDLVNAAACIAFDLAILKYMGWRSLFYLIAGSFVGGGVHPIAGHFIAEHYTFDPRQETYSYYGPLNAITYNVGFHNEHHDFPNIPGSRLHKLREIAPEYYNHLHCHMSWSKVVYDYITNPNVGPFSRTKRMPETRFAATKAD
mmetsp:Transcript_17752/g.31642  ORF Transcript_17752/g.31642 Transcript_17752/m.31642 type:complete len:323 (-) Transcript_17752:67-1035(-)